MFCFSALWWVISKGKDDSCSTLSPFFSRSSSFHLSITTCYLCWTRGREKAFQLNMRNEKSAVAGEVFSNAQYREQSTATSLLPRVQRDLSVRRLGIDGLFPRQSRMCASSSVADVSFNLVKVALNKWNWSVNPQSVVKPCQNKTHRT